MANDQDTKPENTPALLSMRNASSFMRSVFDRSLFVRERQVVCDNQFEAFIKILEQSEYQNLVAAQEAVEGLYWEWAEKYEILKNEFNAVWDLFQSVENRVTGWFCVSPNLAPWKTVSSTKLGYTFAACIMKNHHRDAPLSEKSLSVSFGLDEQPVGIGDERLVGYQGSISDILVGLNDCQPKSLREQGQGAKELYRRLEGKHLVFRLNHRSIGQQVTKLPLTILQEYSLRELCQGLFLMLNNDIKTELNSALADPERLLIAAETHQSEIADSDHHHLTISDQTSRRA